jgi:UDP-N-acetylmuramate dehydrogenase
MAYKKDSQPMAERSAGCAFKNPTLAADISGAGVKGSRISAGRLIDLAGCKGLRVGGAHVSERHANFIVTIPGARARDVVELMDEITRRVHDQYGVTLEPEVVVWRR